MRQHDDAFIPIISSEVTREFAQYTMPLGIIPNPIFKTDVHKALKGGLSNLQRTLWAQKPTHAEAHDFWRTWLDSYLQQRIIENNLEVDREKVKLLVAQLPEPKSERFIHGDATLGNLVYVDSRWTWIDPNVRKFVPWDPHVDLGKMLQSCWGYERVLLGGQPRPELDTGLAIELSTLSGLDWRSAELWLMVHALRLLPYQELRLQHVFTEWLNQDLGLAAL